MSGYYYINVDIVMRDCRSATDAVTQLIRLMPCKPDETTAFMESWSVESVSTSEATQYDRMSTSREFDMESMLHIAEENA